MTKGSKSQGWLAPLLFFIPQYTGMHPTDLHFRTVKLQWREGRGSLFLVAIIKGPKSGLLEEVGGNSASCRGIQGLYPKEASIPPPMAGPMLMTLGIDTTWSRRWRDKSSRLWRDKLLAH
ncbi:MAG: hypothetical protein JPMHGGIA_00424 [Saprospiraceae bacterium]|jgi:hypothetical protein|nr:hypothetical protein [Saprospiraceae bacterium]